MRPRLAGVLIAGFAVGCLPETGDFTETDGGSAGDGGPVSTDAGFDAGSPDLGADPLDGCDPLLPCVRSCDDALFASVLWEPTFETFPSTMTLVSGTVFPESDALVFERDDTETFSTARSTTTFSDVLLCARIRMPGGGEGISSNLFAVGLLTGGGGVELFLEGRDERFSFLSAEVLPDGVLLGRADHAWVAAHELVVLVYLSGERAYAEVLDLVTSQSFAFPGTYRGEQRPAFAWFSAGEPKVLEPVLLLEAKVGTPSASARVVLE